MSMIKVGPAGGTSHGKAWDEGGREKIVQIFISHGEQINSLQFLYVDEHGKLVLSEMHGGNVGPKFNVVKLNYPSEYLTGISGSYYCNSSNYEWQIFSVTFSTKSRTYGPFGVPHRNGSAFEYQLGEDRAFGGFHGRAGEKLNALGVYVKPITTLSIKTKKYKCPLLR